MVINYNWEVVENQRKKRSSLVLIVALVISLWSKSHQAREKICSLKHRMNHSFLNWIAEAAALRPFPSITPISPDCWIISFKRSLLPDSCWKCSHVVPARECISAPSLVSSACIPALFLVSCISCLMYSASHVLHVSCIPCLMIPCLISFASHLFRVSCWSIPYLFHVSAQIVSQPLGGSGHVSTFGSCLKSCLDFKPRLAIGYA